MAGEADQTVTETRCLVVKIAPSILSADFARLGEQVKEAELGGADYVHVDVMDGHYVPNITVGPLVVRAVRSATNLPLDVHLMIERPDDFLTRFAAAGADILTVHCEATRHLHRSVKRIKDIGLKAGVSLNPATPLACLEEILPEVDLVLLMTVNPGFGGQDFIESSLSKIRRLRQMVDERELEVEIEVDGGINTLTAPQVAEAGADILACGAFIFDSPGTIGEAIETLRQSVEGKRKWKRRAKKDVESEEAAPDDETPGQAEPA